VEVPRGFGLLKLASAFKTFERLVPHFCRSNNSTDEPSPVSMRRRGLFSDELLSRSGGAKAEASFSSPKPRGISNAASANSHFHSPKAFVPDRI
jgi:hypothetical protein